MGWSIQCNNEVCNEITWASEIVDLIQNHTDENGWFLCNKCGENGYIEKKFKLQEEGHTWEPILKGVIPLGIEEDTYQPFVFLVSYSPDAQPSSIWFSYYKDLRDRGGRLKLGYGPGGPPVLDSETLVDLLDKMLELGCIKREDVLNKLGL